MTPESPTRRDAPVEFDHRTPLKGGTLTEFVARLEHLDRRLLLALILRRRPLLDWAMRAITRLGDPVVMLTAGSLLLFGADLLPIPAPLATQTAMTVLLTHFVGQLVKRRVSRERPRLPVGLRSLATPPDRFSFPSGHAAAALALTFPLALWLPMPWGGLLLACGLLIGASRAYLGVHYPGDILAGWCIALGSHILLRALA